MLLTKIFRTVRFVLLTVISQALCFLSPAYAGTITLNWVPELSFYEENEEIAVRGGISIRNSGDEAAFDTFPIFRLGAWKWAGDPKTIKPGSEETWSVSTRFSRNQLSCELDPDCKGADLPASGLFPLYLLIVYHDSNRYSFSAPTVLMTHIGRIDSETLGALQTEEVFARISLDGDGEEFTGDITLRNGSNRKHKVAVSFFTAKELAVTTSHDTLELSSNQEQQRALSIKNISGLPGNEVRVFGVAQFESKGARTFVTAQQVVLLKDKPAAKVIPKLIWYGIATLVGLIGVATYLIARYLWLRSKQ